MIPIDRPLRVLHVGSIDVGGGAAVIAGNLARVCRERGCHVDMVVGQKRGSDPHTHALADDRRLPYRLSGYSALQVALRRLAAKHPNRGWGLLSRTLRVATHPHVGSERARGFEDFEFPGTYDIPDVTGTRPDILHCHNLHGGFFDLRALSWLSQQIPTVVTMHDSWLLSGHCAHSLDCERWKTGCGHCPDLNLYPAVARDATALNWRRKRDIYGASRLYVATPTVWLMRRVHDSMLMTGAAGLRVIPHGVDLTTFRPDSRAEARRTLGIDPTSHVVLVRADTLHWGSWTDHRTLRSAVARIARRAAPRRVVCVALGESAAPVACGDATVKFVGHEADPAAVARYYQAADVYLHVRRADTFPTMVLESLACGTPVVAAAVGGVPEQVRSIAEWPDDVATGVLVRGQDADSLADAVVSLLIEDSLRARLSENAVRDARARFDLSRLADDYLAWYRTILTDWTAEQEGLRARDRAEDRIHAS